MIRTFNKKRPVLHSSCYVDDNALVIGDVNLNENVSIWPMAVLRGDNGTITIGANSNIQDNCTIHEETTIGQGVSVGHNVIIHGAIIKDNCLIGMGSTVLDDVVIGNNCLIGANSLVTKGTIIEDNSLVLGSPAKVVRKLKEEEIESIRKNWLTYVSLKDKYK